MSQLDELLARSREPASYKERKHFTLSREKAIEKQREFALRTPKQYVTEIIQGAIFAGATYMAVDARKNDILIAWVGAPALKREELENLFDYLFANKSDKRVRHLVQLAIGINAIIQAKPKSVRVESGADGTCIRMEMDANGKATIGEVNNPISGTYLVAEFDGGWLGRFGLGGQNSMTMVEEEIEKRCMYTPVPILLNMNAPFGFRATRNIEIFGARDQEPFDDGDRRGVIAVHGSSKAASGFRIVVGGVYITDLPLPEVGDVKLVGVICDDGLRKTSDNADIVQDVRYHRMLHAVQPYATALIKRAVSATYVPPALPHVPPEDPDELESQKKVEMVYDPLPDALVMVGQRGTCTVKQLLVDPEEPLFWCTPEVSRSMKGAVADELRFPFRLLVLSEGQVNTLGRDNPELGLHRLNAPADIDFVLRVMERGVQLRTHTVKLPNGELTLRLHLAGRLPAWSNGRKGTPVLIRVRGQTRTVGCVSDTRVFLHGVQPYELSVPLTLPRVSVVFDARQEGASFDDDVVRAALLAAWHLAAPEEGEVDRDLLASLLGTEAQPQFAEEPAPVGGVRHPEAQVTLAAALPPSWPDRLRLLPLVDTPEGALDLDGFLELVVDNRVAWVRTPAERARMEVLERRFGHGHIACYAIDEPPLFAVAYVNARWRWINDTEKFFKQGGAVSHLVYVPTDLAERLPDPAWTVVERRFPEVVAVRRQDAGHVDFEDAYQLLYEGLKQAELQNLWERHAGEGTPERAGQLGRLVLLRLAERLGPNDALLLPSDGGGRWSLERIRQHAQARLSASNGVAVVEPATFCLSYQAAKAVSPEGAIPLRFDDHPDVWRSLAETSSEGWLLRTEVTEVRLRGWLGLRMPYDATAGILLRTTGTLVALPGLDERIPCHGLLWPTQGHHLLSEGEKQLLQLAGLKMYAQLVDLLKTRLAPEVAHAARLYAWVFCHRAHLRGRLSGTAMQLARQVEVFSEDGRTWGTLDRWLESNPARRPAHPPEVVLREPDAVVGSPAALVQGPHMSAFTSRLNELLPGNQTLQVRVEELGQSAVVAVRFEGGQLTMVLNVESNLVAEALKTEGAARELVLLEMARCYARWSETSGQTVELERLQQMLLSQRLEG